MNAQKKEDSSLETNGKKDPDADAEILYDRFVKDLQSEETDINREKQKSKLIDTVRAFQHKIFNKATITDFKQAHTPSEEERHQLLQSFKIERRKSPD